MTYAVGFRAARLWWRVRRPAHDGALVALWCGGRVLMVRSSYRPVLSFPGGGVERGETPVQAAARELAEEVGLELAPDALTLARESVLDWDFRLDHVRIFECRLDAEPVPRIDRREIVEAAFMRADDALAHALPPFVRDYLEASLALSAAMTK
jgi:8-oxo-dGTP diphosphatase